MSTPAQTPAPQQITILYGIVTSQGGVPQQSLTFDAWISEQHTSEMVVTSNPCEKGYEISDHCFMNPLRVAINAAVSDLKMPTAPDLYSDTNAGRSRRAFEVLTQLQADCTTGTIDPFDIMTGLRYYKHMVCTSISAVRDAETAQLLAFDAQCVEIITVETQVTGYSGIIGIPKSGKPTHQAGKTSDGGKKQPQPPPTSIIGAVAGLGKSGYGQQIANEAKQALSSFGL